GISARCFATARARYRPPLPTGGVCSRSIPITQPRSDCSKQPKPRRWALGTDRPLSDRANRRTRCLPARPCAPRSERKPGVKLREKGKKESQVFTSVADNPRQCVVVFSPKGSSHCSASLGEWFVRSPA